MDILRSAASCRSRYLAALPASSSSSRCVAQRFTCSPRQRRRSTARIPEQVDPGERFGFGVSG